MTTDELRAEVRAVLREVLPAAVTAGHSDGGATEKVTLRTAADLDAFVRRVAALCDDPAQRSALQEGRRRFQLTAVAEGGQREPSPSPSEATARTVVRVERGAVTERTVKRAAAEGARLVVGPKAVLTPLARDRARALGVHVQREER